MGDYSATGLTTGLVVYLGVALALCLPFVTAPLVRRIRPHLPAVKASPNRRLFFAAALMMTLLTGVLIPSSVIAASPQEFVIVGNFLHPVWYIISASLTAAGFFLLWLGIFYWLFSPKVKVVFERVMLVIAVTAMLNYLVFDGSFGTMSANLAYERAMFYSPGEILLNFAVIAAIAAVIALTAGRWSRIVGGVIAAAAAAVPLSAARFHRWIPPRSRRSARRLPPHSARTEKMSS